MISIEIVELYVKYGVGAFLTIVMTGLFIWMIKYFVIRTVSKIEKVGETLDKVASKMETGFDKLWQKIDTHEASSSEASRYVREEHKQMIETLGRINGYQKE